MRRPLYERDSCCLEATYLAVECEREVHEYSVVLRDCEVMHHDRIWQSDVHVQLDIPTLPDNIVVHPWPMGAVPNTMQLACERPNLLITSYACPSTCK